MTDDARRRELKRAHREREASDARRVLGLTREQLAELRGQLEDSIERLGMPCDHTLVRCEAWASGRGLDPRLLADGLRALAINCDCEVVLNGTPDRFGWR